MFFDLLLQTDPEIYPRTNLTWAAASTSAPMLPRFLAVKKKVKETQINAKAGIPTPKLSGELFFGPYHL